MSIPHNNYCSRHNADGKHIVGKPYRKIYSDLGITENVSVSGKKFLEIIVLNGISSVVRWEMFSGGRCERTVCKHYVNFSGKSPHFSKFPGSKVKGHFTSHTDRGVMIIIAPPYLL